MKINNTIHLLNSSLFIIIIASITTFLLSQVSLLEPVNDSVTDWDFTDLYYRNNQYFQKTSIDTNILIVNMGHLDRAEIGELLNEVNSYSPKVVVADVFFRNERNSIADSILELALANTKNLVMVGNQQKDELNIEKDGIYIATSHKRFARHGKIGVSNVISGVKNVIRGIPSFEDDSIRLNHVSIETLKFYDPSLAIKIISRNYSEEVIKYQGHMSNYLFIDYDESNKLGVYKVKQERIALKWMKIKQDLSIIKDKIVMIGFVGKDKNTINEYVEELYSTPLKNNDLEYKLPDMYGVVIHANVISMYLNNDSVTHIKFWSDIVNGLILLAFVLLIHFLHSKFKSYNQFIDRGISLFVIFLLIQLSITLFSFNIYFDFTLAVFWLLFSTDLNELYVKTYIPVYDSLSIAKKKFFIVLPITIFILYVCSKFLHFSVLVNEWILLLIVTISIVYFLGLAGYGFNRKWAIKSNNN